jgi:4-amino-4-deoxy-L-arabinose transferase-like glycosyltransferase
MLAWRKWIIAIVLLGAALRVAAAIWLPDQGALWDDARAYRLIGRAVWTTGRYESFLYMPLYPLMAGISEARWTGLVLDIGISSALIWLVYELTLAVFADRIAALLAALGTACYPQFIAFAVLGLTEPLFMSLFAAAFLFWYRSWFVAAAVAATLSILTRPAIDLLAPVLVVYFALFVHQLSVVAAIKQLATYALVYCALMSPWWLHNYNAYGTFVRLNLAGGENLYAANNPMNKTGGGIREVDFSTGEFEAHKNPVDRDRALMNAALDYIKRAPGEFIDRACKKFVRFWRLWPHFEHYAKPLHILMYMVTYVPVFVLTMVYLVLWSVGDFRLIVPILGFAAYLTLVNMVFVTSLRYRLPIEPFMLMFAAVALVRLHGRWRARRAPRDYSAA